MTTVSLADTLRRSLADGPEGPLCVAFSGGPDSTALLHALAALPEARARGLRAVHVDHALHPDSRAWAAHCERFCSDLQVPVDIRRVHVDTAAGLGPEAAARDARYAALARSLQPGELLLTAQHRDDQAETVLLKLLRGAGPEGLGGMRGRRAFGNGWLWRPLLDTPRDVLVDYLRARGLESLGDPSNRSTDLARNFLRLDILPRLATHWPRAVRAITHGARHNRQAADYLRQRAREAIEPLRRGTDASLDASGWLALHPALQVPVLESWLHAQGLPAPGHAQLDQLQRQIPHARDGRVPLVRWPGAAVHVWRGRLHAHPPLPGVPPGWKARWHGEPLVLPGAIGTLRWTPEPPRSPPGLEVRLGETGVRLRPAGDRHTRELRDLFQQAGIPPWKRRRIPMLYDTDGRLLAVVGLWSTDAGAARFKDLGSMPELHATD